MAKSVKGNERLTTKEARKMLVDIIEGELKEMPALLKQVKEPEKRIDLTIRLLPFIVPKLQDDPFEFDANS